MDSFQWDEWDAMLGPVKPRKIIDGTIYSQTIDMLQHKHKHKQPAESILLELADAHHATHGCQLPSLLFLATKIAKNAKFATKLGYNSLALLRNIYEHAHSCCHLMNSLSVPTVVLAPSSIQPGAVDWIKLASFFNKKDHTMMVLAAHICTLLGAASSMCSSPRLMPVEIYRSIGNVASCYFAGYMLPLSESELNSLFQKSPSLFQGENDGSCINASNGVSMKAALIDGDALCEDDVITAQESARDSASNSSALNANYMAQSLISHNIQIVLVHGIIGHHLREKWEAHGIIVLRVNACATRTLCQVMKMSRSPSAHTLCQIYFHHATQLAFKLVRPGNRNFGASRARAVQKEDTPPQTFLLVDRIRNPDFTRVSDYVTAIVFGITELHALEAETCLRNCLAKLNCAKRSRGVLPGAGFPELACIVHLERTIQQAEKEIAKGDESASLGKAAAVCLRDAFEAFLRTLLLNAGEDASLVDETLNATLRGWRQLCDADLISLRDSVSNQEECLSPLKSVFRSLDSPVYDILMLKEATLRTSVEAAQLLLRAA